METSFLMPEGRYKAEAERGETKPRFRFWSFGVSAFWRFRFGYRDKSGAFVPVPVVSLGADGELEAVESLTVRGFACFFDAHEAARAWLLADRAANGLGFIEPKALQKGGVCGLETHILRKFSESELKKLLKKS